MLHEGCHDFELLELHGDVCLTMNFDESGVRMINEGVALIVPRQHP